MERNISPIAALARMSYLMSIISLIAHLARFLSPFVNPLADPGDLSEGSASLVTKFSLIRPWLLDLPIYSHNSARERDALVNHRMERVHMDLSGDNGWAAADAASVPPRSSLPLSVL